MALKITITAKISALIESLQDRCLDEYFGLKKTPTGDFERAGICTTALEISPKARKLLT